jgi:hypothetical protein
MGQGITCPKLKSYWHFYGCRYDKISRTCSEPDHIDACPLPSHRLRNGRLNQMAYTLFLFIRDIADGDLVGWIDRQFRTADDPTNDSLFVPSLSWQICTSNVRKRFNRFRSSALSAKGTATLLEHGSN